MSVPMATSKLLRLHSPSSFSSSSSSLFLALYRKLSPSPIPSRPLHGFAAKVPSRRIHFAAFPAYRPAAATASSGFEHYSSGSSTAAIDAEEGTAEAAVAGEGEAAPRPWPEWESFIEKLKSKGYFEGASVGEGEVAEGAERADPMDFNRVKAACLAFARERFDLLRSLPREDIHAAVECGCPNTHRKPTNSGKRLRAYLTLNERDVCSACSLQGSCDRANLVLDEEEGARTVDILRVILCYAADPALLSRFEVAQREKVEGSIRRLLSELIKLSDTVLDPEIAKTTTEHPKKKEKSQGIASMKNNHSPNVEMKRGDWICSKCNFLNFARNLRCLKCKADGPKRVDPGDVEMKKGDWSCPQCQFMNFARNRRCKRCQQQRPPRELNPGEWECPSCDFLNFQRNRACLKCNCKRPGEDEPGESAEHEWRKPEDSRKNLSAMF